MVTLLLRSLLPIPFIDRNSGVPMYTILGFCSTVCRIHIVAPRSFSGQGIIWCISGLKPRREQQHLSFPSWKCRNWRVSTLLIRKGVCYTEKRRVGFDSWKIGRSVWGLGSITRSLSLLHRKLSTRQFSGMHYLRWCRNANVNKP